MLAARAHWLLVLPVVMVVGVAWFYLFRAPPRSTLERIRHEGVLRWGADPSGGAPFAYVDPNDPQRVIGFEVDIMDRVAAHLGVKPVLVRGDWLALIDNMKAHRTDLVLNGLEVNDERAKVIAFTTPYYAYEQQLTVRAADQAKYRSLDDLKGKKIAVLNGSASVDVLKENGWPDDLILEYDDSLTPYTEVKLGRAEAALAESIIATYYAGKDAQLHNVPGTFSPGEYAAAVRLEDMELLAEINHILDVMKQSGELGEIYQKWSIWTPAQEQLGIVAGAVVNTPTETPDAAALPSDHSGHILIALLKAAQYTLLLTALSMPLALMAGLVLALLARSRNVLLRWPAVAYIQVMRGTPLLVQIYLIYYSLPQIGQELGLGNLLTWPNLAVGVLCLSANYAAYEAEIHRAGIEAVPKGQREAALSIGMSERQAFVLVVLPQSFRIILPPVINDLVAMLKDSCLVSVIGVPELLQVALGIGKSRFIVPEMLIYAAIIYLILSLAADRLGKGLEAYLKRRGTPAVPGNPPRH
ncbi:MAG: ABC transporter permease subunit [Gemmataceae bacterium]